MIENIPITQSIKNVNRTITLFMLLYIPNFRSKNGHFFTVLKIVTIETSKKIRIVLRIEFRFLAVRNLLQQKISIGANNQTKIFARAILASHTFKVF